MHSEAAYVKFQNQPYKIVPDPNNMDDIKFIKLGIHTVQAEVNAWGGGGGGWLFLIDAHMHTVMDL